MKKIIRPKKKCPWGKNNKLGKISKRDKILLGKRPQIQKGNATFSKKIEKGYTS